jgi:predicted ATPase
MEFFAGNWKYNKSIFMLPPWKEIYTTDNERKQDWDEAVLTFEKMCETYKRYGYNIVEVPKKTISERADFVLAFIRDN